MNELISIIVPIYNSENYIKKCLDSIKKQKYENFETIIIDDGSTDAGYNIIKKLIKEDKRFIYYYQKNNGPSIARNKGLDMAKGKYIVFIDADDYVASDYLEKLLNIMEEKKCDICCCGYTNICENNSYQHSDYIGQDFDKNKMLINLFTATGGTICSKIFKKSILNKKNIRFNNEYSFCEDQLFILEYICNCDSFETLGYYGYYYVRRESSITSSLNYDKWYKQIDLLEKVEDILNINTIDKKVVRLIINNKSFNIVYNILFLKRKLGLISVYGILKDKNINTIFKRLFITSKIKICVLLPIKFYLKKVKILVKR